MNKKFSEIDLNACLGLEKMCDHLKIRLGADFGFKHS